MKQKTIQHGAEAVIILQERGPKGRVVRQTWGGGRGRGGQADKDLDLKSPSVVRESEAGAKLIVKNRLKKSYRLPELDERIRKLRTRGEARLMEKASKIIPVPNLKKTDEKAKEIHMDFIEGKKLSDNLDSFPLRKQKEIMRKIGENIAKLHDANIIHGDLTTSNMILVEEDSRIDKELINKETSKDKILKNKDKSVSDSGANLTLGLGERDKHNKVSKVFFIDFGLGFGSHKFEDKAVDLHLLRQALEAKHFKNWEALFAEVQKGYSASKDSKIVLERFRAVERRGRYKDKY